MIEFEGYPTNQIEQYRQQTESQLAEFKKKFNVSHIVSISGSSDATTLAETRMMTRDLFSQFRRNEAHVAILTGGTKGGIPEIGLEIARENNFPTIAVFPQRARIENSVRNDLIDLPIEALPPSVGKPTFGTETSTFAQIPNMAVIMGGGLGTLLEVSTMLKLNQSRRHHRQVPIYVCPIIGTGGTADMVSSLTALDPYLYNSVVPHMRSGSSAGRALVGLMEGRSIEQIQEEGDVYRPSHFYKPVLSEPSPRPNGAVFITRR